MLVSLQPGMPSVQASQASLLHSDNKRVKITYLRYMNEQYDVRYCDHFELTAVEVRPSRCLHFTKFVDVTIPNPIHAG